MTSRPSEIETEERNSEHAQAVVGETDNRSKAVHTGQAESEASSLTETVDRPSGLKAKIWDPLLIPQYRAFWIAGLFSNFGTWIHETGAQWAMTSLDPNPEMVASVRTWMAIPVFCLALPAGVWADHFDRRKWLLGTQYALLAIAALLAALSYANLITPEVLLFFTGAMGIAMIMNLPAWQALTPTLVPKTMVPTAVQVGSVSFNLARSIGPAIGGLLIYSFGVTATFTFNALSFLGMIGVLLFWNQSTHPEAESLEVRESKRREKQRMEFWKELYRGLVVVSEMPVIRNVLIRVFMFGANASIIFSLLSLVTIEKMQMSEVGFGMSLALIGFGAVAGTWFLPEVRQRFGSEQILVVVKLGYAAACLAISLLNSAVYLFPVMVVIGVCWMTTMTTLNATAQVHLPTEFRARGMASYLMSFSLGLAVGSYFWGQLAKQFDLSTAFAGAAVGLVVVTILSWPLKIGKLE